MDKNNKNRSFLYTNFVLYVNFWNSWKWVKKCNTKKILNIFINLSYIPNINIFRKNYRVLCKVARSFYKNRIRKNNNVKNINAYEKHFVLQKNPYLFYNYDIKNKLVKIRHKKKNLDKNTY